MASRSSRPSEGQAGRIVFLDYLRVVACLMVMVVHACEPFYLGGEGMFIFSSWEAVWVTVIDSAARACVPLFVMASAYLLFPVTRPTGEFFRRRLLRVAVPFAIWTCIYTTRFGGDWGKLLFNFPADIIGGHLWFVPMLIGLYLLMPLLSPWAEKATEKEVRGWLAVWAITTTFPYLRRLWGFLYGEPSFGAVPYLYGECPWNAFGTFQYVSGFFGYMLLGFWFRKFAAEMSWRRTLAVSAPLWAVGYLAAAVPFYLRIPVGAGYPVNAPYAAAVDLEMSWEFCSTGVALTVAAYFLVIRKLTADGAFYRRVIRPLSEASYGTYLLHMLVLAEVSGFLCPRLTAPLAIVATALISFVVSSIMSLCLRRIPRVGAWLCG